METQNSNSLEELSKILKILLKHIKLIIVTTLFTTIVFAVAVIFVIQPKYQSTAEIIVNQKLSKADQYTELQQAQSTDLQLVNTYKSILTSQSISNSVKKEIGAKAYNQSKLNVDTDPSSQVISLDVTSGNDKLAAKVANTTANVFKQKIKKIMNINNVSIISPARVDNKPVSPKKALSILAGIFVGIILGIFLALFKEFNAKTIDNVDYITNDLGLTSLGIIDDINIKQIKKSLKN